MQHRGTVQHVCGLISVRHIHSSYGYTKQFIMSDATFSLFRTTVAFQNVLIKCFLFISLFIFSSLFG